MRKNIILIVLSVLFILAISVRIFKEYKIRTAKIVVKLKQDLTADFYSDVKVSDFIEYINGEIDNNYIIDTTKVGIQKIKFNYTNFDGIYVSYYFMLDVKDVKGPLIWLGDSFYLAVGSDKDFYKTIVCADDTDDNPNCFIEGEYDTSTVGSYNLRLIAKDKYGNESIQPFTLYVYEPNFSDSDYYEMDKVHFSDAIKKYKSDSSKIGIDISSWQEEVDFEKLKSAGVEFAILRVGSKDNNDDYFLDYRFKRNIEGFNKVGIPVGIYFYSYAKDVKEAKEDAKWVLKQIKGYKVELPIAFDFEDWYDFNSYHLSLYDLSMNAKVFLETISNAGYKGMLYSSKNYLEYFWYDIGYPIWLAHYAEYTDYKSDYMFWQFSNTGLVDGIYGDVDLDIMYERR